MDYETGKWLERLELKIDIIENILLEKFPDLKEKAKKD